MFYVTKPELRDCERQKADMDNKHSGSVMFSLLLWSGLLRYIIIIPDGIFCAINIIIPGVSLVRACETCQCHEIVPCCSTLQRCAMAMSFQSRPSLLTHINNWCPVHYLYSGVVSVSGLDHCFGNSSVEVADGTHCTNLRWYFGLELKINFF